MKADSDFIGGVGVREAGDYRLLGAGSYVGVEGQLGVTSLTRTTVSPPFAYHASTIFDAGAPPAVWRWPRKNSRASGWW